MAKAVTLVNAVLLILLLCYPAFADMQQVEPEVRQLTSMRFGMFAVEHPNAAITVDARSGQCVPHGVAMIRNQCERGRFEIRGIPESHVLVTMLDTETAGDTVRLESLSLYPENNIIRLGANGKAEFYIGGKMVVLENSSNREVSVNFNLQVSYIQ